MKTKDGNGKIIFIGFVITIILFICVLVNQWIEIREVGKVDEQEQNSFVSTENVNTRNGIKEENIILDDENITQDTTINQTEGDILTTYKGYPVIAKLEIPKIDLETYVISEYSNQALGVSVTKFYGGNPNEVGNFCIAGHNYITKNMFHDLKNLSIGDTFTLIDTNHHEGMYKIYSVEIVEPDETQCLSQKTEGRIEVTLITCTTDSSKRIIVKAVKI